MRKMQKSSENAKNILPCPFPLFSALSLYSHGIDARCDGWSHKSCPAKGYRRLRDQFLLHRTSPSPWGVLVPEEIQVWKQLSHQVADSKPDSSWSPRVLSSAWYHGQSSRNFLLGPSNRRPVLQWKSRYQPDRIVVSSVPTLRKVVTSLLPHWKRTC